MKKGWGCLVLWLAVWLPVYAESDADIVAARIPQLAAKMPQTHPRLLLTQAELPQFRQFVSDFRQTPAGASLWQKLAIEPGLMPPDEPAALPAKKGSNNADVAKLWREAYDTANDAGNAAWRYALQYLVTGDARYGREAAHWLMVLSSWRADHAALRNNDEQFIQATRPMIFAYDWAYDALTPDERNIIEKTLISRMALLKSDMDRLFSLTKPTAPSSNLSHPMRFISTLGQGGQAMFFEQPEAQPALAWAYEYYNRQFPVWGGADGGWAEGLDYWASGNSQHLRFLEGMQLLGFDAPLRRDFFRNNAYFAIYTLMPYPGSSFGDLTNITKPDPNRALLLEKYAQLNRDPYPQAFSRKLASGYPEGMSYYTFNALDSLLHQYRQSQAPLPEVNLENLPQSRYFADIGWVAMHSHLGDKNRDVMLTLKSSPYGSASHSHNDQNAFVINAYGEPLAIQSGYRDWYDSAHHLGWTRQTQSKNAILVDGQGQPSKDPEAQGHILNYQSGAHFTYATGDASPAYRKLAERVLRHVLFVNRRYFVMLDEIDSKRNSQFQWLLHARESMRLEPEAGAIVSHKGKANLRVSFLLPAASALQFSQTDAFAVPVDKDFVKGRPNEWHAKVETQVPQAHGEFLTVLYPYPQQEKPATNTLLPTTKGLAAHIEAGPQQDWVLLARSGESQVQGKQLHLQGRAAFVSRHLGALQGWVLVDGQQLQTEEVQFTASRAVSVDTQVVASGWHLAFNVHPDVVVTLNLAWAPRAVQGLERQDWHYDAAKHQLVLNLPQNVSAVDLVK